MMNELEECFDSSHHWLARTDVVTGSRLTEQAMELNVQKIQGSAMDTELERTC